jgi:hypothetical protein
MPNRERYRELLENMREAHAAHAAAYKRARSKCGTNQKAHEATKTELESLHKQLNFFYESILAPLLNPFLAGEPTAIDEVLTFLEVDIAAFRTGYSKAWYYRKLKSLKLSAEQIARLREVALNRCASSEYRREDSELRRLMIKFADEQFIRALAASLESPNPYIKRKKGLMLQVVLKERKDLQKSLGVVVK